MERKFNNVFIAPFVRSCGLISGMLLLISIVNASRCDVSYSMCKSCKNTLSTSILIYRCKKGCSVSNHENSCRNPRNTTKCLRPESEGECEEVCIAEHSSYICDEVCVFCNMFDTAKDCFYVLYNFVCEKQCEDGFTGYWCNIPCHKNCLNKVCESKSGNCVEGCRNGFYGPMCQQSCDIGRNCKNNTCLQYGGECVDGCKPTFSGPYCRICDKYHHGEGCANKCSPHCAGDGSCFWTDGACNHGCKNGYSGHMCTEPCPNLKYGKNCQESCSNSCKGDGTCDTGYGKCNYGCVPGYNPPFCTDICPPHRYGDQCASNCSQNCAGTAGCDVVNGICTNGCKSGYTSETCEQRCEPGTFGFNCNNTCQYCKNSSVKGERPCAVDTGTCLHGCVPSYKGDDCIHTSNLSSSNFTKVLGIVTGIVICIAASFMYFSKVKKLKEVDKEYEGHEIGENETEMLIESYGDTLSYFEEGSSFYNG